MIKFVWSQVQQSNLISTERFEPRPARHLQLTMPWFCGRGHGLVIARRVRKRGSQFFCADFRTA